MLSREYSTPLGRMYLIAYSFYKHMMPLASDPFDDHSHQTRRVCMFIENTMLKRSCDPRGRMSRWSFVFYKHMKPPASKRDHANYDCLFFLFKNQYTGTPENISVRPIIASRGRVTMVLQKSIRQKTIKRAGTIG